MLNSCHSYWNRGFQLWRSQTRQNWNSLYEACGYKRYPAKFRCSFLSEWTRSTKASCLWPPLETSWCSCSLRSGSRWRGEMSQWGDPWGGCCQCWARRASWRSGKTLPELHRDHCRRGREWWRCFWSLKPGPILLNFLPQLKVLYITARFWCINYELLLNKGVLLYLGVPKMLSKLFCQSKVIPREVDCLR